MPTIPPHVDIVFPTRYRYNSTRGGAEFSTTVIRTRGGRSFRNINWQQDLQRWEVSFFDNIAFIEEVRAFHRARFGAAQSFLFKDHDDYQARSILLGVGDGSRTTFQLLNSYANGTFLYTKKITKPAADSIVIYLDGVVQPTGWTTNAVVNAPPYTPLANGIITFDTAPSTGVGVGADCDFYIPVRFGEDYLAKGLETHGGNTLDTIALVEERL